jgi:hypothetical protein
VKFIHWYSRLKYNGARRTATTTTARSVSPKEKHAAIEERCPRDHNQLNSHRYNEGREGDYTMPSSDRNREVIPSFASHLLQVISIRI